MVSRRPLIKAILSPLSNRGFVLIDECLSQNDCSLFCSERWWQTNFKCTPPGFVGAATGLAVGNFYISPIDELSDHPRHRSSYGASTSKQMSGNWTYYSEDFVERTSDS